MTIENYLNIKAEKQELNEQIKEINKKLKAMISDFKLSSFSGETFFRFRAKWGDFDQSSKQNTLNDEMIENFSYLIPHDIVNGEELNLFFETTVFENSSYILFVEYEEDFMFEDPSEKKKEKGLSDIYDFFIIKL